jgi:hypothetical protein
LRGAALPVGDGRPLNAKYWGRLVLPQFQVQSALADYVAQGREFAWVWIRQRFLGMKDKWDWELVKTKRQHDFLLARNLGVAWVEAAGYVNPPEMSHRR